MVVSETLPHSLNIGRTHLLVYDNTTPVDLIQLSSIRSLHQCSLVQSLLVIHATRSVCIYRKDSTEDHP